MFKAAVRGRRRGASVIEYVSVMAIGAAALAGGALAVGGLSKNTFANAGQILTAGTRAKDDLPKSIATLPDAMPAAEAPLVPWWAAILLLGCGAVGLLFVRRPSSLASPKSVEPEELRAVPERLEAQFIAKRQQILQVLGRELWCVFDGRILVQDILTECPTTVRPNASVETVRALLQTERIHHVLVVDLQGRLQGVISDRDFAESSGATAASIMTPRPETVGKTTPVVNAISLMLDRAISCLPVVDGGRVVGIVTSSDMLMTLQCCVQLLQRLASTMWQPGVPQGQPWNEERLVGGTSTKSGDDTGRLFDVMNAMSSHS